MSCTARCNACLDWLQARLFGCADPGRGIVHINHSEMFDINEPVLGTGVDVMLTIALDFLSDPAAYRAQAT